MTDPLIVDVYELDGPKDWAALAAAGVPWIGARVKATQGTYYHPKAWLDAQMHALINVCPERNGRTWFFGGYCYLDLSHDGKAQADYFLDAMSAWNVAGLLAPMADVERAAQAPAALTPDNVIDTVSAFAARVLEVLGRKPTLYGGELLAALGITDHMGCDRLAIARYTPTLPHEIVTRIGWDQPDEWQYCGDGAAFLAGYPCQAPGCGKVDISAVTSGIAKLGGAP